MKSARNRRPHQPSVWVSAVSAAASPAAVDALEDTRGPHRHLEHNDDDDDDEVIQSTTKPTARKTTKRTKRPTRFPAGVILYLLLLIIIVTVVWKVVWLWRGRHVPHVSFLHPSNYQCVVSSNHQHYNRRVLFVQIATLSSYYTVDNHYKGGEYYMAACLDYALRENGWTVERRTTAWLLRHYNGDWTTSTSSILDRYDLIVANGHEVWQRLGVIHVDNNSNNNTTATTAALPPHQLCKLRTLSWWGDAVGTTATTLTPMHHRQYWKPYPTANFYNTFVGYFPHSLLLTEEHRHHHHRGGRVGLLLGKTADALRHMGPVVQALLDAGLELHTTCGNCREDSILPAAVVRHGPLSPIDYVRLLRRCAFLLGAGRPYDSPSPLEGLANGVAFLNPLAITTAIINNNNNTTTTFNLTTGPPLRAAQHTPLALLGPPYVYNVRLDDAASVVAAAERAVAHRFDRYVPADFSPLAVVARVCSLLQELDAVCDLVGAPITTNGLLQSSSSSTVRKAVVGYDANQLPGVQFYGPHG